jgi:DNA ligase 1
MNQQLVEELNKVVVVFDKIKGVSGRKDKETILKGHEQNAMFREMLSFLYNTYVLTGIKSKKLEKFADFESYMVLQPMDIYEAMGYITTKNSGRDKDVQVIANFINKHEGRVKEFLKEFFTKDYKCGITASTINKVYGKGTIPEFDVMLAKKFEDEEHKITGEFIVTEKLDGIRCLAVKENGEIKFFTRQGQPIYGLIELEEELKIDIIPDNTVFDGELLSANYDNLASDDLFRLTQKVVRKDGDKLDVEFHIYDTLPLSEFKDGKSKKTTIVRKEDALMYCHQIDLHVLNASGGNKHSYVKAVLPLYTGKDKTRIFELLDEAVADNKEGVMVSKANAYYVTKRTDGLLKVKKMHTVDLRVIGVEEGSGKNKGTLGALIVDYKGYKVKVGSGFTDEERHNLWNGDGSKDDIMDKIIEVQYFEESKNQDGGISLRFPVFKGIRDDKTEPSLH